MVNDTVISTPDGRMIRLIYKRSPDGGWATTLEDVTERRRVAAKIEHLAHYDALTNLPNRTLFQRHAEGLLLQTADVQFAILYIDIDEFKRINDSLGHLIGDEFLRGVSGRLLESVGPERLCRPARRRRIRHPATRRRLRRRCRGADREGLSGAANAVRLPRPQPRSDASIGVAIAPRHGSDLFGLLKSADLAMYAAKAAGRRTHRFFEPSMEAQANLRRELETGFADGDRRRWL